MKRRLISRAIHIYASTHLLPAYDPLDDETFDKHPPWSGAPRTHAARGLILMAVAASAKRPTPPFVSREAAAESRHSSMAAHRRRGSAVGSGCELARPV